MVGSARLHTTNANTIGSKKILSCASRNILFRSFQNLEFIVFKTIQDHSGSFNPFIVEEEEDHFEAGL